MKKVVWIFAFFLMAIPISSKMSKAMKNFKEGQEESVEKMKPKIDFLELKKRLEGKYKSTRKSTECEHPENIENIFKSDLSSQTDKFWDRLNPNKIWDLSFVDYTPAPNRVEGVNGMLKRSKLVMLHDSEEMRYKDRPKDLNHKRKFSTWNGAKALTDCSEPLYHYHTGTPGLRMTDTRLICTTVIKGDKDDGLWEELVKLYTDSYEEIDSCFNNYNHDNKDYCTHLRLLIPAALLAEDILELGSGLCSTSLLHNITLAKRNLGGNNILYTLDNDREWLNDFADLRTDFHKVDLIDNDWMHIQDW